MDFDADNVEQAEGQGTPSVVAYSDEGEDQDFGDVNIEPTAAEINVRRLLGRDGFLRAMRRIIRTVGRYPPLDSFPIHEAYSLRPYHRFSDATLYDKELFRLLRRTYVARGDRPIASEAFFRELDRIMEEKDECGGDNPLSIAALRHPSLTHSHTYMAHRISLTRMTDVVHLYNEIMQELSPVYNAWHREFREITQKLLYVIGRLDQAASYGDLMISVDCLGLIDDLVTSLWSLCEIEYTAREDTQKAGF